MGLGGVFRPGMRAYFIPLAAGAVLASSTFLPWVIVGGVQVNGVPDVAALSLVTRRNSRHPLLLIGLLALGIMFLSWRIMPRTAGERAQTISQAFAIVENRPVTSAPVADVGIGIYLGLAASVVLVAYGMTIVVKRVARPYTVVAPDDDVD